MSKTTYTRAQVLDNEVGRKQVGLVAVDVDGIGQAQVVVLHEHLVGRGQRGLLRVGTNRALELGNVLIGCTVNRREILARRGSLLFLLFLVISVLGSLLGLFLGGCRGSSGNRHGCLGGL